MKTFLILISLLFVTETTAQNESELQTINYHGIRSDDPGGRCGLRNPERGFRHEAYIGHPPGYNIWGVGSYLKEKATSGFSNDWFLMNVRRYEAHGITLLQAYCYLTDFNDKSLSEEKFAFLQRSLDRCRQAGLKVLLRFSYEKTSSRKIGPTIETILGHIDQLAPLIQQNKDVIYVLQAGFVGAWGEWHNSAQYIEENHSQLAAIIAKELQILPKDRMIQLRVMPEYKYWVLQDSILNTSVLLNATNAFSGVPEARLGFANDGFMANESDGSTWPEPPFYANPGNPEFDIITRESPYMAVDGELYWSDQGGQIDGLRAAIRMRLHHFTSLSFTHSYSGYEGKRYSIDRWMETPLSEEQLNNENLSISDSYFKNYAEKPVERTAFEYIRDHLGYRIELQSAKFPQELSKDKTLPVEIDLINRGFATLINPRPVYLVLINTSGEFALKQKTGANPQTWQPFTPDDSEYNPLTHSITGDLSLKGIENGEYMLGLWMPDADESIASDSRYAVRVANRDAPWWTTADGKYGVNILGTVTIMD